MLDWVGADSKRRCVKVRYVSIDQVVAIGVVAAVKLTTGFKCIYWLEAIFLKSLHLYTFPIHIAKTICIPL